MRGDPLALRWNALTCLILRNLAAAPNMKQLVLTATLAAGILAGCGGNSSEAPANAAAPNILFVIMDDVGIDQMKSFGYGGLTPPSMPNMNVVAAAGVRFRNTWSMPECTPGRAAMFLGRFPCATIPTRRLGPTIWRTPRSPAMR
jgi:hypothetical protein